MQKAFLTRTLQLWRILLTLIFNLKQEINVQYFNTSVFYPCVAVLSGCLSTLMLAVCYGAPSQTQYLNCSGDYSTLTYDDCQGKYHDNQAACYHIPMHSQYKPCAGICNNRLYPSRAATKCQGVCPCKLATIIHKSNNLVLGSKLSVM